MRVSSQKMTKKSKKKNYTYAVGRRKFASARVRLFKGKKENLVNDIVIGKYFPGNANTLLWQNPFKLTETMGKYYVTVRVVGGGKSGQIDATVHGIARALSLLDSKKYRVLLKNAGLLTRDPRTRERRKAGTGGRARHKKQSPKR